MNRTNLRIVLCASAVALVAPIGFAQEQSPFTPAAPVVTTRLTPDAASSVVVKVDGSRVIDVAGQPLGRIENIVLSPVGCAEAAILTAANGRLIPIPWTLVRVSGDTRAAGSMPGANMVFTVNAEQARLAQAPSFTRSQFPDFNNQLWLQQSINFFGTGAAVGATGGSTNAVTGGATNETRIGTTATGGPNQSRFGTTATTVPTNSTTVLPPTGRPNPGRPDFDQPNTPPPTPGIPPGPPSNIPPDSRPENRQPLPGQPGPGQPAPGTPPPASPPPRGASPPASPPAAPPAQP